MAQTSNESSTKPSAESPKTVTISQDDADRCANNTKELIAARDEIRAYKSEIVARDKRDANTEKLLTTYEKALTALDTVIAAQNNLSADKDELIKAQNDLLKTLMQMPKKKNSPVQSVLSFLAGIFLGRIF